VEVALIQLRTPAVQVEALRQAEPLIRQAAAEGAKFIATPEGSNLLQRDRARLSAALAAPEADVAVRGYARLAAELGVWISMGSALVRRPDGLAANRAFLFDPSGEIQATYDKIHMFDVDLPTGESIRESRAFTPGARAVVSEAAGAKIGLTICYDMRFPALYRDLALAGAEILLVPAAFTRPTGAAHWEVLLRARAIETGAFVLAAAQGGTHEDGRSTWGRSMVVSPWGEILALADHDAPCVLRASLDMTASARARRALPVLANARDYTGP
jgi:predicted amidohydrolase